MVPVVDSSLLTQNQQNWLFSPRWYATFFPAVLASCCSCCRCCCRGFSRWLSRQSMYPKDHSSLWEKAMPQTRWTLSSFLYPSEYAWQGWIYSRIDRSPRNHIKIYVVVAFHCLSLLLLESLHHSNSIALIHISVIESVLIIRFLFLINAGKSRHSSLFFRSQRHSFEDPHDPHLKIWVHHQMRLGSKVVFHFSKILKKDIEDAPHLREGYAITLKQYCHGLKSSLEPWSLSTECWLRPTWGETPAAQQGRWAATGSWSTY